jgi:uncharacterized protein
MPKPDLLRTWHLREVGAALKRNQVVALVGPRQTGKTTLARQLAAETHKTVHWFDLENPNDLAALSQPALTLPPLKGLVILDEIQRLPEIFPLLRVLADRKPLTTRFLVLGSASDDLMRQSSESLAGRIHYHELPGFRLEEVGLENWKSLWLRGGFPRSTLANSNKDSLTWREGFIQTFLERDIPNLGLRLPVAQMRRFWTMAAHYHGQTWNGSELARSLGLSDKTVLHYAQILEQTFMARLLPPWHENAGKRIVKSPKFYLRDSGLFHVLQGIRDERSLQAHPKLGASWEGFALEEVLKARGMPRNAFFWATQGGAELDLLIQDGAHRIGFEFKYNQAPTVTKSMHIAMQDLRLDQLWVVYPGTKSYPLADKIQVIALQEIANKM